MNATSLLTQQHRQIKAALKKLESRKADDWSLLLEVANTVAAHMAIEQEIFYPAARMADEDLVIESFEEHAIAELALKRLVATDPTNVTFTARVTVLREILVRHIDAEEQDLFPKVEKGLGAEANARLGKKMKAAFDSAVERGYEAALPRGSRTSADAAERRALAASNGHAR